MISTRYEIYKFLAKQLFYQREFNESWAKYDQWGELKGILIYKFTPNTLFK